MFGAVIDAVGMRWSFRIGGIASIVTCVLFALLHNVLPPYTPKIETEPECKEVKEQLNPGENKEKGEKDEEKPCMEKGQ